MLYLAWEAAHDGKVELAGRLIADTHGLWPTLVAGFAEALIARTALAAAQHATDPATWLAGLGSVAAPAQALLPQYTAPGVGEAEADEIAAAIESRVEGLEQLNAQRSAEAISARVFIDNGEIAWIDPETGADLAGSRRMSCNASPGRISAAS